MNPMTHFLAGWLLANSDGLAPRERAAVVIASIVPDLDGVGIIAEKLSAASGRPLFWWSDYHHVFGHNLLFGIIVAAVVFMTTRRYLAGILAFVAFHLHLLGDILGARGPDGYNWPINYLYPISGAWKIAWKGQWAFNAWPTFVITASLLAMTI